MGRPTRGPSSPEKQCFAVHDNDGGYLRCFLDEGHDGPHENAYGNRHRERDWMTVDVWEALHPEETP
jgi:hypothetical protein